MDICLTVQDKFRKVLEYYRLYGGGQDGDPGPLEPAKKVKK